MKKIENYGLQDMERAISQRIAVKSRTPPLRRKIYGYKKELFATKWYLEDEETLLTMFYHEELGVICYQFYKKKR